MLNSLSVNNIEGSREGKATMLEDTFKRGLEEARHLEREGLFFESRDKGLSLQCIVEDTHEYSKLLYIAELLLDIGYPSDAEKICVRILELTSDENAGNVLLRQFALYYLSVIAGSCALHDLAFKIVRDLLISFPNNQRLWQYIIVHMTYIQSGKSNKEITELWGNQHRKNLFHSIRPCATPRNGRPLRVGYVSADFKNHPVGFFIRGVILSHNTELFQVYVYSSNSENDNSIVEAIKHHCVFRDVSLINDEMLDKMIREDKIDILVDLSGHTAGNRLTCFAMEPAPVMVSWLGYWATTGLSCIDAVILDNWHAPEGTEKDFVEKIERLPVIRFCYQPLGELPQERLEPPCLTYGHITFGSFNNTVKYNSELFDVWGHILKDLPTSRLLLKWKNFHDPVFRERIARSFEKRGIERSRIEMRGWSLHVDMLAEFADVDILLDTFPFTGGITTCNALWMGVPVVSLQGETVVGRQGYAILKQLDLEELAANSTEHYINIAEGLANNTTLLSLLRCTLRSRMRKSKICDVKGFTKHLEDVFIRIYDNKTQKHL